MKTFSAKPAEVERKWFVVDLEGKVLGRYASKIARILRGKHKPSYTPHVDTGDCVIVVNAEKLLLTGKKPEIKNYYQHSDYPGGFKVIPFKRLIKTYPERVVQHAIRGMLPKNTLGREMIKKLKVYAGAEHPHKAQMPVVINLDEMK